MTTKPYTHGFWESADGLKLHYREYAGPADKPALLCIPGLTRNARDFEPVAKQLVGDWRIICVELRGRGRSEYAKHGDSYLPQTYVGDMLALFDVLALDKVVALGTSLGGIITALLVQQMPERFAGVILNDIGPDIEPAGLERIQEYVGQGRSFPTWMHAARGLREQSGSAHPDFSISDWLAHAKRLMWLGNSGRIAFDYDMRIAEPFLASEGRVDFDMWPAFRAISGRPSLVIRGEMSDILSAKTMDAMAKEIEGMEAQTIKRVGHAPILDEVESQEAIARLLNKVA